VLIPEGKALPIQPEVAGTVVEVRVREGTRVAAGDVLAVLDSEKAGEQLFTLSEAALKWKNAERAVHVVLPVEKKKCDDEIGSLDDEVAHLARERGILLKKKEHEEEAYRLLGETHGEQLRKLGEAERRLEADLRTSTETHALRLRVAEARAELYRKQ